ncbi:hypothetical protein IGI04_026370 [Brassica rapa subsp. trilocularis]|uniref:Uncharacterized protein n=1 Tax=Brassica rapa subsp. trilocularis TaxID=1813537 RepID=A0ABQ7KW30_BRACM|nr:hypothetical protein IGI04_026370 [Brassica rapa subsp. trilocularis]
MAATKMFLIKWYSSSTNLESSGSRLEVVWTSWKSSDKVVWTSRKSSGLPGSRLDFQEVVWTSRKSSGLPGSRLDFQEVVWTSRKSSGLLGSRLDFSERFGKFLIRWYSSSTNLKVFQIWKTSGTTYLLVVWKSSGLLGSLLTKSSGLPGSRLDFLKVVWTSCKVVWKSSEHPKSLLTKSSELPGSRLDFLKVVWTSWKSSDKVFFHIKWNDLQLSRHRLVLQLKKKTSRFNYIQTTYNSVVHETTEMLQISKSIAKIASALTRRLPGKSSRARRLPGKSSTARRLPNFLAYIRLLQAHRITNESNPPRIVSFYGSMNHKKIRIKILGFFSSLWRESEIYVVFSSQEWKKKKGKSILGALRTSNWLFIVVVVLMTMAIL